MALVVLLLSVLSSSAHGQAWIRQHGTVGRDLTDAAAEDGAGGVYVGGSTDGSLGGPNAGADDAWLERLDSTGSQLWIRQLGTTAIDWASAAATDGSGGVYLGGATYGDLAATNTGGNTDAWFARFDAAGNRLWTRQIGTSAHDFLTATAPDGVGGAYFCGFTGGSLGGTAAGNWDAWLARYDGAGNQLWARQLGTSYPDLLNAAAPDGSGGVYIAGFTHFGSLGGPNAGSYDVWLARYDSSGTRVWIRQQGTSADEQLSAAAPDGSGGVFIGGFTFGDLGGPNKGGQDVWLARYDSSGARHWILQLGTSSNEDVHAATSDGTGGVYLGGMTDGSLGGPNAGSRDVWLARFDGSGGRTWLRQLGSTSWDEPFAAAPALSSGVYFGGRTAGNLGGPSAGGEDAWTALYEAGAMTPFCTSKGGLGCGTPQIDASGIPSVSSTSGFVVRAGPARSCKSGMLLYNTTSLAAGMSFQGGTLCVTPSGIRRGGPTSSQGTPGGASCDGEFALDMNAFAAGAWSVPDCAGLPSGLAASNPAAFLLIAGQDVYCQFWGRDSVATGSFVSAGVRYTVLP